jgi:hypothetical protein
MIRSKVAVLMTGPARLLENIATVNLDLSVGEKLAICVGDTLWFSSLKILQHGQNYNQDSPQ